MHAGDDGRADAGGLRVVHLHGVHTRHHEEAGGAYSQLHCAQWFYSLLQDTIASPKSHSGQTTLPAKVGDTSSNMGKQRQLTGVICVANLDQMRPVAVTAIC